MTSQHEELNPPPFLLSSHSSLLKQPYQLLLLSERGERSWLRSLDRLSHVPAQLHTDARIEIPDPWVYVTFDGRRVFGEVMQFGPSIWRGDPGGPTVILRVLMGGIQ